LAKKPGFLTDNPAGHEIHKQKEAERRLTELREIARFIKNVDSDIPWYVTQFYPTYKLLDRPRTSVATIRHAREFGMEEGLRYVYEGNAPGEGGANIHCYAWGPCLLSENGLELIENRLQDGKCPECGIRIDGVGM